MVCRPARYFKVLDPRTHRCAEGEFTPEQLREHEAAGRHVWRFTNYHLPAAGRRVTAADVVAVAGFFVDLDGNRDDPIVVDRLKALPEPSLVVATGGPGRAQVHWILREPDPAVDLFTPIQRRLARLLGGDPACCDVARVHRVPGYVNPKWGRRAEILARSDATYAADEVLAALDEAEATLAASSLSLPGWHDGSPVDDSLVDDPVVVRRAPCPLPQPNEGGTPERGTSEIPARRLPGRLLSMIGGGLARPSTRNQFELEFARLCVWAGLSLEDA